MKLFSKAPWLKNSALVAALMVPSFALSADVEQAPPLKAKEQAYYDTMRDKSNAYFVSHLKKAQDVDGTRTLHPKLQYHLEQSGRKTKPGTAKSLAKNKEFLTYVRGEVDRIWRGRTIEVTEPLEVEDRLIEGPGGKLEVRIYTPKEAKQGPLPILVYYHGGGWLFGSIKAVDRAVRLISTEADVIVVSANYRMIPENPFPAAQDDALAVFRWARDNAKALGGVATNVAVGGDSAGGNMSASVTLMTRDLEEQGPSFQLLYYPALDVVLGTAEYPSFALFRDGFGLTEDFSNFVVESYFPDEAARHGAYASPLRAKSHKGLPPAIIATGNFDILRDQGKTYAGKLQASGVAVTYLNFGGLIHGFMQHTRAVDEAREAVLKVARLFGRQVRLLQK